MKIANSWILITGTSRGIGKSCALEFAKRKAKLILVNRKMDVEFQSQLKQAGSPEVVSFECDLSKPDSVKALIQNLQNQQVDILFHNAGLLTGGLFEKQKLEEVLNLLQVNVNSVLHLTHAILPQMLARQSGKVVIQGSVSSYMRFPCASTYAASKAAVVAFAECLSAELEGTGVSTLSLITPGIKTEMFDQIEKLYGPHFETPKNSISAEDYAVKIAKSIESDDRYLNPVGAEALGLWVSKHIPSLFRFAVLQNFKR